VEMKVGRLRGHGTTRARVCALLSVHVRVKMVFLGASGIGDSQIVLETQNEKVARPQS
jgi:hypothetical protein